MGKSGEATEREREGDCKLQISNCKMQIEEGRGLNVEDGV